MRAADDLRERVLFTSVASLATALDNEATVDPTIIRSRFVRINWNAKAVADGTVTSDFAATDTFLLNLFEDVRFRVVRDTVGARKGITWQGHVDKLPESEVTLVAQDGILVGNIRVPGAYFQVRYVAPDLHVVRQIDELRYPPDGEPIPVRLRETAIQDLPANATDDGTTFDVLVAYTPAARAAAGGTAAMNALINLAVAETNTAYSRSGVIPRVRLVHSQEVAYTESGNFSTDLNRLTNGSDGFMDNVQSLRNTHGADLVSLIIEGTSLCGIGWLMTTQSNAFEAFAFSVTARICATGNFTFGHEMGHNMGLQHDRADAPEDGVFPHSHGYVDAVHSFRTIMGVQPTPPCCTRIQNFANPNVANNGFPTGVPQGSASSADAAASLNATRFTVANWRQAVVLQGETVNDFDEDGETDIAVYQSSNGNWFVVGSTSGFFTPAINFGGLGYLPVPGDYDGDGETDVAVYQTSSGNWFVVGSTSGFFTPALNFGGAGYIPVPGDYDGDGRTDAAVYQQSTGNWFIMGSTAGLLQVLGFGGSGYVPVPSDYDGDGRTDAAVYQQSTGNWFVVGSTLGFFTPALNFGGSGYLPVPGDRDGDGKSDAAVYQSSTGNWFALRSTAGFHQVLGFGGAGFNPVAGDYDGDGKTDAAVYQQSTGNWFVVGTSAGFFTPALSFGGSGFVPVLPQVTILRALGLL